MCSWYRQFYLFVCFALFFHSWTSQSITISLVEQLSLLEWSLLMEEIQQTAMNHWFYWDLLYQGVHWSCSSSILATWKVCYFWTQFEFSPQKKKSKQHFRYPFLIPWKCFMAENHWKSALLNLHFCRKEKYLPISRRSSGSRSGSKLKPPQKVFPQKRKWWELFGRSRVQGTWPSHLFTFHPSKGRPTGPDFNSWYGLVNATPLNPANGTKNRENISRLGKKTW